MHPTAPISNGVEPLTNDELRIRFPEKDFDGYWLVGAIRGNDRFEGMFLGFGMGVNAGYDWGFRHVVGDPNFSLYVIRLIGREDAVTYAEQPIHRHQFEYDHRKLDVRLEDRVRIRGEWPDFSYYMASPDKSISVEFDAKASIAHWSRDMVLKETSWVTVAMIDFEYEGIIRVDGEEQHFTGLGTLDHPSGRLFKSPTSPGMGWWEYNAFMLDEKYGLYQWKIVDSNGEIVFSEAATNYPDGKYHSGSLDLNYTRFEDRGGLVAPREWTNVVRADHGTFEYRIKALGQDIGDEPQEAGTPLPNFLLELEGEFKSKSGEVSALSGKGTGESVICELNPETGERQKPW